MTDAAVQHTDTSKSMVVDHALSRRLARDHQRKKQPALWIGGAAIVLLFGFGTFALNGNFRSLILAAFWGLVIAIGFVAIRHLGTQKLTRVIEGLYPSGEHLTVTVSDTGVTVTTSATSLTVAASALWRISTAPHSVMVRIHGLIGPAMILPRELLDDADVARLRALAPRIRRG
ncbi:hypothetical protein [Microbacterium oleivorans]|uniref:hypothetical protein n=1 Tax=Microbacterium oleivorans TaxID=273677 RepID=UPI0007674B1F|nr:hypothetical protein [Microbacterium oleivorans]